jgi:hypothetical protein
MMDLTKYEGHTEGPWSIDWNLSCLDVHSDGWTVCRIERFQGLRENKTADNMAIANSRLIADAPALLAEVVRLRALAERVREVAEYFDRQGYTCTFEGEPMVHMAYIEEFAALAGGK